MEVVLDSNFIVSCMKNGIDFFGHLEESGFKVAIPKEVVEELKDLRHKVKHDDRIAVDLALDLFSKRDFKRINLGKGKVDDKLVELGKNGAYIATLDSYIKRSVPNTVGIDSRKNGILIERK
jgi:rRNA-processing protein FCF1